jgi:CRP-like cAMP-binding protein
MKFLRAYIEDKIEINDKEWNDISTYFTKINMSKGEEFYTAGDVSKKLFYLASGIARTYTIATDGTEITLGIHYHNQQHQLNLFMGDYISYLEGSESPMFCETLADCVVYETEYAKLDVLYESSLKWMKLARKISDTLLIDLVNTVRNTRRFSAKERYTYIQNLSHLYEEVLTDYQLASMLGITPQSFSRIKKS